MSFSLELRLMTHVLGLPVHCMLNNNVSLDNRSVVNTSQTHGQKVTTTQPSFSSSLLSAASKTVSAHYQHIFRASLRVYTVVSLLALVLASRSLKLSCASCYVLLAMQSSNLAGKTLLVDSQSKVDYSSPAA